MNREHRIFQGVCIKNLCPIINYGLRILPPACSVNHNGVLNTGISKLRYYRSIPFGPVCPIPCAVPLICDVKDNGFFFADERTFHFNPVICNIIKYSFTIRAGPVMDFDDCHHFILFAQGDQILYGCQTVF
ncbi:hypothetical protein D3C73_725340 [compost metagenome]